MDAVTPVRDDGRWLRRLHLWAIVSMVANAALIVTGGLVRLTRSGMGCPTWPKCDESYLPDEALGIHGVIEFSNRLLTFVLVALALGTFLVARKVVHPDQRLMVRLAFGIGLGIIAQALIGGVTVLTHVNPWVVGLHLVVSLAIVAIAAWLVHLTGDRRVEPLPARARAVTWAALAVGYLGMLLGTVVTGAGPNSGDDAARRNGLDLMAVAKVHAWCNWGFVLLTIAAVVLLRGTRAGRIAIALLVLELVQGATGYWQYFHELTWTLVFWHILGVAVISIVMPWLLVNVWPGADGGTRRVAHDVGGTA